MTRRRAETWALVLCVAALAAGCGSSGDSTTASGTASAATPALKRLSQVPAATRPPPTSSPNGTRVFLRRVFDDAQAMWHRGFEGSGVTYKPARLTIFTDQVATACGTHGAYVGPFYCPASSRVYLDTRFFSALSRHVGVQLGDFAQGYVVAHEVGHHVQTVLGLTAQKAKADEQDPAGANARSVRFELQADCFAGVWAHSAQRQHWFTTGFTQGTPAACDTASK